MRIAPPGPVALAVAGLALALALIVGGVALASPGDDAALAGALVAAAALALGGGLVVQAFARRPVRRLSRDVRSLTTGRARTPVSGSYDEDLSSIAASVNDLRANLQNQLGTARTERGRLEQTLASAADVVLAVSDDTTIVYANPAASAVLSVAAQEALGRPLLAVLGDHEIHALVKAALAENAQPAEATVRRDERHYQTVARPLTGGGLWAAVLIMHDVSTAHQAEQTRRDFVANVSHELRTPLASIAAAVETLELGVEAADAQRFHRIIHQESDKMAQLVEEMLDLARLESGLAQPQLIPVDICVVARDALDRIRPQADRAGLTLALEAPASVMVRADADLVQRALANLLHNAVKFTPAPGRVTVRVEEGRVEEGRVEEGRVEEGQVGEGRAKRAEAVWLCVTDTGIGVSEEDRGRVFQRFYRADWARRRGEGTGLGLALVRHIAESHGGAVRVESRLGEGSTFGFSLPRTDG